MNMIYFIAKNTVRELYRNKFFISLFFISLGLIFFSLVLGEMSFEEQFKILFDMGTTVIHLLLIATAILLGSFSMIKEFENQTYQTLLATPLTRHEFLFGKFIGLLFANLIAVVILGAGLFGLLSVSGEPLIFHYITILFFLFLESILITGLALLFAMLFSPFVSVFLVLSFYVIGHWLPELKAFSSEASSTLFYKTLGRGIYFVTPHLFEFNLRSVDFLKPDSLDAGRLLLVLFHFMAWLLLLLFITSRVFKNKNL